VKITGYNIDEVGHTACQTIYRVCVERENEPDVTVRIRLWMIVGGEPALDYENEHVSFTRRYPVVQAYTETIDYPDGDQEYDILHKPKWRGYYPHQQLINPSNPDEGVVHGPTINEVLPNKVNDFIDFIDDTLEDLLRFRARWTVLTDLLGHYGYGALRSKRTLVRAEGYKRRIPVVYEFRLNMWLNVISHSFDYDTHYENIDREDILDPMPQDWANLDGVINAGMAAHKEPYRHSCRWDQLTEVEFNDIVMALRLCKGEA